MAVVIKVTHTRCNISGLRPNHFKELSNAMSYDEDYQKQKAMGYNIPAKVKMITPKGTFWVGLLSDVKAWLKAKRIKVKVEDQRLRDPLITPEQLEKEINRLEYVPRPYQREALLRGILAPNGIIHIATGGGKTFVMGAILAALDLNTLILVNSADLARQLRKEIAEIAGVHEGAIGFVGDSTFEPKKWTVALVQSLTSSKAAKKKKDAIKKLCEETEILFVDEAHHTQASTYKQVIRKCKNVIKRIGFTATPMTSKLTILSETRYTDPQTGEKKVKYRQEKVTKEIVLKAYLGDLLVSVSTGDLIRMGYLSRPEITFIKNEVYRGGGKMLPYAEEYERCIIKDRERNQIICNIIKKHYDANEQIIGFVTRIEHGETLKEMLLEMGIPDEHLAWVSGQNFSSERKSDITAFQDGHIPILLGTVLSEGLNFFCHAGINCSGGDSDIQAIQRLGRILRKPKSKGGDVDTDSNRTVKFYDFQDQGHRVFARHGKNRFALYEGEGHEIKAITVEQALVS